jgi:hypothetical protein
MKWFRSNIRHGARAALLAFAIQLVLSFGHFHGIVAQAAPSIQSAQQQLPASGPDPDQQPGQPCAICAVIALANTALVATPPLLPLPLAADFLHLTQDAGFAPSSPARIAFQPRAPPLS